MAGPLSIRSLIPNIILSQESPKYNYYYTLHINLCLHLFMMHAAFCVLDSFRQPLLCHLLQVSK